MRNRDLAYASNTLSHQVHVLALDNRNVYNVPLETLEKFSQLRVLSIKGHDFAT